MSLFLLLSFNSTKQINQLLPESFNDWKVIEKDKSYTPENLFDFINGGAELYLSFGFKKLIVRRYSKSPNHPTIEVNLFNMGSYRNAFGIFHHDLEDEEVGIGQDSEYGAGWLRFWKGNYFVYIFAEQETPTIKQAILNLGRTISKNIAPADIDIDVLKFVPREGMIDKSLRFFYNHTVLNYHYYLASDNILNLSNETNAIFARYEQADVKASLLVIQYQNNKHAATAYENFITNYLPEANNANFIKTENGKWTGITLNDKYLIIVVDASTSAFAEKLTNISLKKYEDYKDEK